MGASTRKGAAAGDPSQWIGIVEEARRLFMDHNVKKEILIL